MSLFHLWLRQGVFDTKGVLLPQSTLLILGDEECQVMPRSIWYQTSSPTSIHMTYPWGLGVPSYAKDYILDK